ncbi:tryptophan synthase subunit alpha [Helicobacter cetorum]|uniref:Tryptophan synthase alpha chain n=1 Tax=Helicobacter cetorum (strain ATCC BAA-540 / CCUG 52418 / MIT 99-5656) TaxID=1163745 RepID=I0EQC6_HELCM|nr:tryptophan synthase subunit alpha [Helicobacter cetorum]AFI05145.1 tryptophan synthase subunit alpha [Helicobacter cetorum MIT 99-5656]
MRYSQVFKTLEQENKPAFIPFVTLGDPNYEWSFEIIKTLIDSGVSALELGFGFSDPVADGAIIQASNLRALKHAKMDKNFKLLKEIREYNAHIPIGLLVYANLIVAFGIEKFYATAKECGVDSILIADMPLIEKELVEKHAKKHEIKQVFIASPNANLKDLEQIANHSQGYIYTLARSGVTGASNTLENDATNIIKTLKSLCATPCLLGFGISKKEHVKNARDMGASGVICGSALVKIIEENLSNKNAMLEKIKGLVEEMMK